MVQKIQYTTLAFQKHYMQRKQVENKPHTTAEEIPDEEICPGILQVWCTECLNGREVLHG
jgi:hypothetical protein